MPVLNVSPLFPLGGSGPNRARIGFGIYTWAGAPWAGAPCSSGWFLDDLVQIQQAREMKSAAELKWDSEDLSWESIEAPVPDTASGCWAPPAPVIDKAILGWMRAFLPLSLQRSLLNNSRKNGTRQCPGTLPGSAGCFQWLHCRHCQAAHLLGF